MASLVHDMLITAVLNKAYGGARCQSVTVYLTQRAITVHYQQFIIPCNKSIIVELEP